MAGFARVDSNARGARVVDLGCGFGWFCRYARAQGAAHVLGIDISEKMLAKANAMTSDGAITYQNADLEAVELPETFFNLAYSSLALHYLRNLERLIAQIIARSYPAVGSFSPPNIRSSPRR